MEVKHSSALTEDVFTSKTVTVAVQCVGVVADKNLEHLIFVLRAHTEEPILHSIAMTKLTVQQLQRHLLLVDLE